MQRIDFDFFWKEDSHMIIDGSMSTALEQLGANLNNKLWTARALADTPELVKQVHMDYFKAGADCGITCSYQATIPGLVNSGFSEEEAKEIIRRSVTVCRQAREEWWEQEGKAQGRRYPLCLAGIGPYGAYLADGSEYVGKYEVSDEELYHFHKERMEILWEAGADLLLIETQPSLREVKIEVQIAEELGAAYGVSFSCRDSEHINDGLPIRECVKALAEGSPNLKMVGVNCTKPEYANGLIREIRKVTDLPVAVYPNSGETYDPSTKTWHGEPDAKSFEEYAFSYFRDGADAVGGCCTTTCTHIEQVGRALDKYRTQAMRRSYRDLELK